MITRIASTKLVPTTFFIAYLALLLKLIVFKHSSNAALMGENFIPLATIDMYLSGKPSWAMAIQNLVGNIILFMPLGLLLPIMYQRITWAHVFIAGIALSLALETLQLMLRIGSFDVDDIILNVFGVLLGLAVVRGIQYRSAFRLTGQR